jgi:nucleoside-diphosphate-sugar epimerase
MNVLVTGAAGFVGRILCARLLATTSDPDARFTWIDRLMGAAADPRVATISADLDARSPELARALERADTVIHLAAVPGGAAERDHAASRRVNLDLSLAMLEQVAGRTRPVRFVQASTIAVFGEPLPPAIDDQTPTLPTMTYGAHKLMVETQIQDLSRRGLLDGLAVRLPGLLARPPGDASMKSAFMSELFHACAAGRPIVVPTGPDATVWIMSASRAVENLLHAARTARGDSIPRRAFTLPALRVTMGALAQAVAQKTRADPLSIRFERDEALEAQFGRLPALTTATADALGFRHDGDLESLVERALRDAGYGAAA